MRRKKAMLEASNIDLHYGAAQALRGISLKAEPGKVTCVLGRNGVGKTSLLRALVGQRAVSAGTIMFDGKDITRLSTVERARRGIAYVPQGREIFPLLTVEENLETGFAPLPREQRSVPDDVFSLFPVLNSMLGRRGGDLLVPADSAPACLDLSGRAVRQICLLRPAGALDRSDLGLCRHPVARSWRLLRARRLRHGHVSDAPDRRPRRLRQSDPARLHGVSELARTAGVLVRVPALRLCGVDGAAGAGPARLCVRLVRLPQPRHRRLSVDHHPGDDLRAAARLFPQQFRVRWQQWPDRFQGHSRLQRAGGRHAQSMLVPHLCLVPMRSASWVCRAIITSKVRQGADRDPRRRVAHALPRLSRRILQAVRVHAVGLHGGRRRRALCAAGRHHQPERVRAGQFHRGGDLGGGRRPRHADRRGARRLRGELRQDVLHQRLPGALLAVHAGRAVHRHHLAAAARHHRHL